MLFNQLVNAVHFVFVVNSSRLEKETKVLPSYDIVLFNQLVNAVRIVFVPNSLTWVVSCLEMNKETLIGSKHILLNLDMN